MEINLNRFNTSLNQTKISIKIEMKGSTAFVELPAENQNTNFGLFMKNENGIYEKYLHSYENKFKINFLSFGNNYFIIRTYNDNSKLLWETSEFCIRCECIEPIYDVKDNKIHLFWNSVNNADGYIIYVKTSNNVFTSVKETKTCEVNLYGYTYGSILKIKPYRNIDTNKVYDLPVAKFEINKNHEYGNHLKTEIFVKKSGLNMVWNKVRNADNYKIYKPVNNTAELYETTTECSFKCKYLPIGTHYFSVKAFNGEKCIDSTSFIACQITDIEMFAVNKNYKVHLYWNKVSSFDGYQVLKKNTGGEYVATGNVKEEYFEAENIVPGEFCEFKVKPYYIQNGQKIYSGISAKCSIQTYKTPEIGLTINEAYGGEMSLSWSFDGNVDGFHIYKNSEKFIEIKEGAEHLILIKCDDAEYQIKGYKKIFNEIVYTSESKITSLTQSQNRKKQAEPLKYKVSVVIPTYNAQNYISRCISSVLGCDLDNIEIIVADDGSSDNTREILSWYAEKYPAFVKTVFKKNGGAADARNYGIAKAKGEYITFIDSDDMIRPRAYSIMYNALISTKSDIAISQLYKIDNERYWVRHILPLPAFEPINPEEYMRLLFTINFNNAAVWNKMYKTELVKKHPMPLLSYEDVAWIPYILSWSEKICYIDKVCAEWDRKIRMLTLSGVLSNRSEKLKFEERYKAVKFFNENGNPKHKQVLDYLMAKRMYNQGIKAKYHGYFDTIKQMKDRLLNNKFLEEDKEYNDKIYPLLNS